MDHEVIEVDNSLGRFSRMSAFLSYSSTISRRQMEIEHE